MSTDFTLGVLQRWSLKYSFITGDDLRKAGNLPLISHEGCLGFVSCKVGVLN